MSRAPTTGGSRLLSLDVLRAVAVLLVLGHHLQMPGLGRGSLTGEVGIWWQRGGWIGVDLFFVLSGFLISGLLFREHQRTGTLHVGRFLVRRGLKIYPAFYVFLGTTLLLNASAPRPIPWDRYLPEALFVQNYWPGRWGHTWSLAVEEHFYLAIPFLLWFLLRRPWRARRHSLLPSVCVLAMFTVLLLRIGSNFGQRYDFASHVAPTHLRVDGLLFGVLLSYFFHYRPRFRVLGHKYAMPLLLGGLSLVLPAFFFELHRSPFLFTFGLTYLYLGFGMILMATVCGRFADNRFTRVLGFVGAHSYSIYLWHAAIRLWGPIWARMALGRSLGEWEAFGLYLFGSVAVGILLSRLVEIPVLRLRDRWFPSRSRALSVSGAVR